jgi:hypothetical protein
VISASVTAHKRGDSRVGRIVGRRRARERGFAPQRPLSAPRFSAFALASYALDKAGPVCLDDSCKRLGNMGAVGSEETEVRSYGKASNAISIHRVS